MDRISESILMKWADLVRYFRSLLREVMRWTSPLHWLFCRSTRPLMLISIKPWPSAFRVKTLKSFLRRERSILIKYYVNTPVLKKLLELLVSPFQRFLFDLICYRGSHPGGGGGWISHWKGSKTAEKPQRNGKEFERPLESIELKNWLSKESKSFKNREDIK